MTGSAATAVPVLDTGRALTGRVALVTGAGRNIGRAVAVALGRAGARVAVNVRSNTDEAEQTLAAIRSAGSDGTVLVGDMADPGTCAAIASGARDALGPVSVLVNTVGVRPRQALHEIGDDDWHYVLDAGVGGAFRLARAVAPDMIIDGWGRIVSFSGRDGFTGLPRRAHGVTTKAAVHGLTKALALELGPHGVTANTIVPGYIDTVRPAEWYPDHDHDRRVANIPVGRAGSTEDVANAVVFLVVYGGYVNGQAIHLNGGEFLL